MKFSETKTSYIHSRAYRKYLQFFFEKLNFFSPIRANLAINIDPEAFSRKIKQFWKLDGHKNLFLK